MSDTTLELERLCRRLGIALRSARQARGWNLRRAALASGLSPSAVARLEDGKPGALLTYLRMGAALGLRLDLDLVGPATALELEDAVHAVMGEVQARRFGTGTREVFIDEPYQHFRFAGRGDLVVVDRAVRALEHSENKTRIVNVGELGGSFNAKTQWLAGQVADRHGVRRFRSETHVLVLLWSEEVLAAVRSLARTFRSFGPDGAQPFAAWWDGTPLPGVHRSVVVFDPIDRGPEQPRWVGLDEALDLRSRYQGYLDAYREMQRAGLA
jgi:transcriptional regulator with XRE-family HTH domain